MSFLEECTLPKVFANLPLLLDLVLSFVSKGNAKVLVQKKDWLHAVDCSVRIVAEGIEHIIGEVVLVFLLTVLTPLLGSLDVDHQDRREVGSKIDYSLRIHRASTSVCKNKRRKRTNFENFKFQF